MMMKHSEAYESKTKKVVPRQRSVLPPAPPPLPKFRALSVPRSEEESVTKREISRFWRQKRIEEEDHLHAATKAAARLRARNLSEQEYLSFELSLRDEDEDDDPNEDIVKGVAVAKDCRKKDKDKEVRVGIKDWWTKSNYAYLNQPALGSMDPPKKRTSTTYVPNCLSYKPKALYPTAIGVF